MKKLALFLILTFACLGAAAQSSAPVVWRTFVKMTSRTEGVITAKAIIGQGWHMYGTTLPEGGPIATKFDFSKSTGVKFIGEMTPSVKPTEKMDAIFGLKLNWWGDNVTFTRKFKLTTTADKASINWSVTYMACNDNNCMPPKTENFTSKIPAYKATSSK